MNVAFLVEYFSPFIFGGSEISSEYLAKGLSSKDLKIFVIAPDFGTKKTNTGDKFKLIRYFFPKKIRNQKLLSPFWHTSLIISIYRAIAIGVICKREKIDLIHVQEKYLLIAGFIVSKALRIPLVFTARDYQIICNYGFCINKSRNYKGCTLGEYIKNEFNYFLKNYASNANKLKVPFLFLAAIRARIIKNLYKLIVKHTDYVVCISKKQQIIYKINGIKNTQVIYNPAEFISSKQSEKENYILYAGKISRGKGTDILIQAFSKISENFGNLKLKIVGSGEFLKQCRDLSEALSLTNKIFFLGQIEHSRLKELYKKARLTVVPSVWEEPFGRVALESLSLKVPVVATNVGGLMEIVDNGNTGIICNPNANSIAKAVVDVLNDEKNFMNRLNDYYPKLKEKYTNEVFKKYKSLYYKTLL